MARSSEMPHHVCNFFLKAIPSALRLASKYVYPRFTFSTGLRDPIEWQLGFRGPLPVNHLQNVR